MDNKVVLGIFVGVLVLFLSVPVLSTLKSSETGGGGSSASKPASSGESKPAAPAPGSAPPLLNAGNLVGSVWAVSGSGIPGTVEIECQANGVAIARHPMAKLLTGQDTITGTWKVEGAVLTATVTAMGKTENVKCDIIGDKLYHKGEEIKRLR